MKYLPVILFQLLWFKNKVLKRKRFWVNRWKKNVTEEIFKERVTAVVILQVSYCQCHHQYSFYTYSLYKNYIYDVTFC